MQPTALHPDQTFVFADIVGFTAITEREGALCSAELAVTLWQSAAEVCAAHGVELVKTIGDAVMLRGRDAEDALRAAIALRDRLRAIDGYPELHIGVHTGEAVQTLGDWFGHAVNLAARVTDAAGPGEILCTPETVAAARAVGRFVPLGERCFKNVAAAVGVLRLETSTPGRFAPAARGDYALAG